MNKVLLISPYLILIVLACGERLPIREMTYARNSISLAESVKADKYASQELNAARQKLYESHDDITKEDLDKAKKAAEESRELATKAYDKSVPLLAKDTMKEAEASIASAEEANAEKLAQTEYEKAKGDFKSAGDLYAGKEFYQSYKKAQVADESAKNARSVSVGKKSILKDSIDEVNHTLEEAGKYNVAAYAPEKLKLAKENVTAAQLAYQNVELKKGFGAVEVAKLHAGEAYLIAIEESAKIKFSQAGVIVEKAERIRNAKVAKDEIAAAKESYGSAKSTLADRKFKESIDYSEEAIQQATVAMGMKETAGSDVASDEGITGKSKSEEKLSGYKTYTVKYREKQRDCLWRISEKFYRNPMLWRSIFEANRDKITNPNLIYPGWVLKIPKL